MDHLERIAKATWAQSYEILPNVITPGVLPVNPKVFLNHFDLAKDFTDKKVLDIGAWDGAITFEAERRGAEIYAMDIQNPDETAFNTAKDILGSSAEYQQGTVYDLVKMYKCEFFDVVIFKGVYYHLQEPLRAFNAIYDVLKDEGHALVAGEMLISYAEDLDGNKIDTSNIAESNVPLAVCYPGKLPSDQNTTLWHVPNLACIKSWFLGSGFELIDYKIHHDDATKPRPMQRFVGLVRKSKEPVIEHPIMKSGWTSRIRP